jgi:maltooligosyltrehalose trehalohydrolase
LLEVYRTLASLRRRLPELTDPAFTSVQCTADEQSRVFTLRRGRTLIAVNFGSAPAQVEAPGSELLFATPTGATYDGERVSLPPHVGVLLRG